MLAILQIRMQWSKSHSEKMAINGTSRFCSCSVFTYLLKSNAQLLALIGKGLSWLRSSVCPILETSIPLEMQLHWIRIWGIFIKKALSYGYGAALESFPSKPEVLGCRGGKLVLKWLPLHIIYSFLHFDKLSIMLICSLLQRSVLIRTKPRSDEA